MSAIQLAETDEEIAFQGAVLDRRPACRPRCFPVLPVIFYVGLLSPFVLRPLAEYLHLPPLLVPALYLTLWGAWEVYLRLERSDLWMRADLFLIIPAQILVLREAIRRQKRQ